MAGETDNLGHAGLAEGTLEQQLDKKQGEFAGLLTREDALELVAREKGFEASAKREQKQPIPLAEIKPGEQQVVARARVWHVFATKHFSKKTPFGERAGKVRNILLRDATGDATVVLWGKDAEWPDAVRLHRNSVVELFGASSKLGTKGLELHSNLTTRLTLSQAETSLPTYPSNVLKPEEISGEKEDVDLKGAIARVGRKSEFTRVKKTGETEKGHVFDCWLEAGVKQVRLVAWDASALLLEGAAAGDAVTLEGASVRKARDGSGLEVHAGWASHILLEKGSGGTGAAAASLQATPTAISKLAEAGEGSQVLVEAGVKSVSNAWSLLKCASCGSKTPLKAGAETNCPCGGKYNKLFVVRALLEDATGGVESVFFNEHALSLLGLNAIPLDASAIIDLKKDETAGKLFRFQLKLKKSKYTDEMECVASSVAPLPATNAATTPEGQASQTSQ